MKRRRPVKANRVLRIKNRTLVAVLIVVLSLIFLLILKYHFYKTTDNGKNSEDWSSYCVPLEGGSFKLENGIFTDYLYGYELNLSAFPQVGVRDPVCKNIVYDITLDSLDTEPDSLPSPLSFLTIAPPVRNESDTFLMKYILTGSKADDKKVQDGVLDNGYKYKKWIGTNGNGNYFNIKNNRYVYLVKAGDEIIEIIYLKGERIPSTEKLLEGAIQTFNVNKDLVGQRKTILEEVE